MPDMGKTKYQTRLDDDDAERVDEYTEDRGINQSEAVRRLVRAGLAQEGYPVTATDGAGQIADRLEAIEARQAEQEQADKLHTAALLTGLLYIVATVTLGLSGLIWAVAGIGAIIAIAGATHYRNRAGDSDE